MSNIPFTVYDVLAYLSSGLLLIVAVDYVYGKQIVLEDAISAVKVVTFLFLAYICGHIIASLSSIFLEEWFVSRLLGRPSVTLMNQSSQKRLKRLFTGYYRPLPENTRNRILIQAKSRNFSGNGEALFLHIYSIIKRDEKDRQRIDEFRNLYGFCRNISFSLFIVAVLLALGTFTKQSPPSYGWSLSALFCSIAMLYRYLKFFRQFSYYLFVTYAELPVSEQAGETQ